jgi:ribonuclease HI
VTTCKHSPTWIGATEHTNNTAELIALAELMRWLINDGPSPQHRGLLRPDSEYAMGIALGGDGTPQGERKHQELTRVVRALYMYLCLYDRRGGRVGWAHVKGHSDHKWNDLVDELATRGSKCPQGQAGVPGWTYVGPNTPRRATLAIVANTSRHMGCRWRAADLHMP